jgi:hypothetical protein
VNQLAERGFPVDHVAIVGTEPVIVEQVTGPLDAWRAMIGGASSGLIIGLIFSWLFALWFAHDGTSLLAILVYWLVVGLFFGAIIGVVAYAFSGRRSFTSQSAITSRHFAVTVDDALADEAIRLMTPGSRTNGKG